MFNFHTNPPSSPRAPPETLLEWEYTLPEVVRRRLDLLSVDAVKEKVRIFNGDDESVILLKIETVILLKMESCTAIV